MRGQSYSEHLNCALTASLCLHFCDGFNWQILTLSCPQEEYEDYSMFLKGFEDEQSCPCRAVCDFVRKVQQGWKNYRFILLAVRIIFCCSLDKKVVFPHCLMGWIVLWGLNQSRRYVMHDLSYTAGLPDKLCVRWRTIPGSLHDPFVPDL